MRVHNLRSFYLAGCDSTCGQYWDVHPRPQNVGPNLFSVSYHCPEVIGTEYCEHAVISSTWLCQCEHGYHPG
jgi:hypothetical protein